MARLSERQAEWIFHQCEIFTVYWVRHPPESDDDWRQLAEQARDLAKRGRDHPLLDSIIVQIMSYIGAGGTGPDGGVG